MLVFLYKYKSQIIIGLIAVVIAASLYFKGYNDAATKAELKYNAEVLQIKNDQIKKMTELNTKYNSAAESFELSLANQKTITRVIHEKSTKEVEKPVYNMCLITDDGLRIINENARQLNSTRSNKSTK